MNYPAPIVLFVYKRPEHTREVVNALLANSAASESDLIIFSDGPGKKDDEKEVAEVREYINTITGFRNVKINESETNRGLAVSVIEGVSSVLEQYEQAIVIEDDIYCSPVFLEYANNALNFYEEDKRVFVISGYTPPVNIPDNYPHEVILNPRGSSWGWAVWRNRWESIDWGFSDKENFLTDRQLQKKFSNYAGEDLPPMLLAKINDENDSWGIIAAYNQFLQKAYSVCPTKSLCRHIGIDSTGTHVKHPGRYSDVEVDDRTTPPELVKNLQPDRRIIKRILKVFKLTPQRKIINFLKYRMNIRMKV